LPGEDFSRGSFAPSVGIVILDVDWSWKEVAKCPLEKKKVVFKGE